MALIVEGVKGHGKPWLLSSFEPPKKVCRFSSLGGSSIPKSVKCTHSATQKHAYASRYKHWEPICTWAWWQNGGRPKTHQLHRGANEHHAQRVHPVHSTQSVWRRVEEYISRYQEGPQCHEEHLGNSANDLRGPTRQTYQCDSHSLQDRQDHNDGLQSGSDVSLEFKNL